MIPPHPFLERLRRRVPSPLLDRLGYNLVPAVPDWSHRPTSHREFETLPAAGSDSLARDLEAAGLPVPTHLPALVETFWTLIPAAPVRQRRGGSGINGALQLYGTMRALQPRFVIESGVFRGLTTWIIRQACPEAAIFYRDPDLSGLRYRGSGARYNRADWSTVDWSRLDPDAMVAFFDDHVAQARRVVEARDLGLTRLLFDDDPDGHRIHAHGGSAHPTIAMVRAHEAARGVEAIRRQRNARVFVQTADDPILGQAAACILPSHAFDDLHRATGYSPARLTSVTLHLEAKS